MLLEVEAHREEVGAGLGNRFLEDLIQRAQMSRGLGEILLADLAVQAAEQRGGMRPELALSCAGHNERIDGVVRELLDLAQAGARVGQRVLLDQEQDVLDLDQRFLRGLEGLVIVALQLDMLHLEAAELGALCPGLLCGRGIALAHDLFEQTHLFVEVLAVVALARFALEHHGLGQLFADAHDGVQAGQRILENHGDFVAANLIEVILADLEQILAVVENFAVLDDRVAGQNAQDSLRGDGLTRAGLAHDGERLALVKVKADVPHRLHLAGDRAERNAQIANLQFLFHLIPLLSAKG